MVIDASVSKPQPRLNLIEDGGKTMVLGLYRIGNFVYVGYRKVLFDFEMAAVSATRKVERGYSISF